mmetsp:Transcript_11655/g.24865  ORF Transcript_11655/g.24865 Transcript_11655/m.24865 type:complete len:668 (+) Transcript_11655:181-2184(+)|eukprot:CAMPEP_0183727582 /NCGR_PEP_ID=MMETSP0737-20130205/25886_1 /TAXON_ID=385413 /ORGANISM="Thalassiosira miniscula, Strain CCMP1093" /LENGTH=667 /DNA_ID=CAMNT_0025959249 /DNA_START=145 /DNA_END=2148 /DNA_ORIENTATION=-
MSNQRKLQTEIDRVMKKVDEGVELFDEIYEKVYSAEQQSQKEKYEVELKKEIKKLQRLRDQIKSWISGSEVKDKDSLLEYRRLIETKMEAFKVVEKETKTKTFSKEGLARQEKLDPEEQKKVDTIKWIGEVIDQLQTLIDDKDLEVEKLSSGKGKKTNKNQIEECNQHLTSHKFHMSKLEGIMRLVRNDRISAEVVDEVKEDLEYYVESHEDDDYMMAYDEEGFYEPLGLDDLDVVNVDRVTQASVSTKKKDDDATSASSGSKKEKHSKKSSSTGMIPLTIGRARSSAKADRADKGVSSNEATPTKIGRSGSTSSSGPSAPAPTPKAPAPAPAQSMAAMLKRESEERQKAQALQAAAAQQAQQQEQARQQQQAELLRQQQLQKQQQQAAEAQRLQQEAALRQQQQVQAQQKAEALKRQQQQQLLEQQQKDAAAKQKLLQQQQQQQQAQAAMQQQQQQAAQAQQQQNILNVGLSGLSLGNAVGAVPSASSSQQQQQQSVTGGNIPTATSGSAGAQPSNNKDATERYLHALNDSFLQMPTALDAERNRSSYTPRNPYPACPPSYPSVPSPIFDNPAVFEKLGTDALFFIFYYAQGTYQQYLAARELKKQSWRYHKKYMTWFQRHEEPKVTTDDYEQGTYVYFDYETGWCQRIKSDFRFEYSFLEDSLSV